MNSSTPESFDLASRLLALESLPTSATPAVRVCAKLGAVLAAFAGTTGFRSLLTRALALAIADAPSLANVRVLEDGSINWPEKTPGEPDVASKDLAASYLIAHLLDLLVTFIGDSLTHQLVSTAWSNVPFGTLRAKEKDLP